MPPPSSKALRWSIVLCLIGPFLFACATFESARAHDWTVLAIALVMLCVYSLLEWVRIRAILRALARRRTGNGSACSGNPATPDEDDNEAVEAARRRRASLGESAPRRVSHPEQPVSAEAALQHVG
jgi:hypothetical protein